MNFQGSTLPKRVLVIGGSCSGKTTFSKKLCRLLGTEHIELDSLYWKPNWIVADPKEFSGEISKVLERKCWVIDGNYSKFTRQTLWPLADTVIWLDPGIFIILYRFFKRTFFRARTGELLWGHSRETLKNSIFQKNSLLLWILKTHRRRQKEYASFFTENVNKNTLKLRLRSPKAAQNLLISIALAKAKNMPIGRN